MKRNLGSPSDSRRPQRNLTNTTRERSKVIWPRIHALNLCLRSDHIYVSKIQNLEISNKRKKSFVIKLVVWGRSAKAKQYNLT